MKQTKKIVSVLLAIVLLAGILPTWYGDVKEAEAALCETVPDVVIADANKLYPDAPVGTKLFFPDIANVPASVYATGTDEAAKTNGKLLAVYYKNNTHARFNGTEDFGEIHMVESTDNGATWSEPKTLVTKDWLLGNGVGTEQRPLEGRDPNLAVLNDGTVLLTFFTNHHAYDGSDNQTYIVESRDGGATWGTPVQIAVEGSPIVNGSKRGDVAIFDDGYVLFPLQGHDDVNSQNTRVSCVYGKRIGENQWSFERYSEVTNTVEEGTQVDECSFVATGQQNGNEVIAFIRETGGVYRSADRGATWEKIAVEERPMGDIINQPGLKLYTNADGETCIYATYAVPGTKYGRPIFGKSVKLSDLDEENGWNKTEAKLIYRCPNSAGECADPSSVITSDGRVLVVYYDGDVYSEYIGGTYVNLDGTIPNDGYEYTETDFGDYGIKAYADCGSQSVTYTKSGESLDGVAISGAINFKEGHYITIGNSGCGITLMATPSNPSGALNVIYVPYAAGGVEILTIPASGFGDSTMLGKDLNVRMTFKFINKEIVGELEHGDLLFGITVEDYTTYFLYEDVPTWALTQSISAKNVTLLNPEYAQIEKLELLDFGIAELTSAEEQGYKASDESLIGKSIRGVYNFAGGSVLAYGKHSWFTFTLQAFDDEWGKRLTPCFNDGECGYQYGTAISAANIGGKDILGADVKIEAMFDFVKNEADDKGNFTVPLLIDDQYTFTYTYDNVSVANVTETIYTRGTSYKLADIGYANAETLTPKDFGVTGAQTIGASQKIATDTPNASLHGKKIKGIYKLNNGSMLVYGSEEWAGSVILQAYDYGGNQYIVPQIFDGAYVHGTTENTALPGGNIYHFNIGNKMFIGNELEIEAYFNFKDNEAGGKDLELYLLIDGQYRFKYTWADAPVQYVNETICATYNSTAFTVIESSAYPNYVLPQTLGATLATDRDVVKMGFSFADVIANRGIAKEHIASYGAVLAPGTKTAADLKAKAAEMIAAGETSSDIYVRTEGDIEKLFESETYEYFVTITNSGNAENMHIRSTAIAYMKLTDGTIYYSADCNSDAIQRVNKSVMGLLKSIFAEKYIEDYEAALALGYGTEAETPLGKAIAKYNNEEGKQITYADITEILNRAKSEPADRITLKGVHYKMHTMFEGIDAKLKGKYISVLGHSIDSYAGVSNDANANTTIVNNVCSYPNAYCFLTQGDMWWSQVIKDKGMQLLVCNASSGAAVSHDTADGITKKGSDDIRVLQLHDDNGENAGKTPDIIAITLGVNDFRNGQGIGTFDASAWDAIRQTKLYPDNSVFADNYAIMLDKITTQYPEAKVFVFNVFEASDPLCSARTNLQEYNEMIANIAAYFGVTVVDAYNDTGINKANASEYTFDGLHFNALGMRKYADAFEIALAEKYAQ